MQPDDILIGALGATGHPVYREASMPEPGDLPASYWVYSLEGTTPRSHYDNRRGALSTWSFSVGFFSSDPSLVAAAVAEAVRGLWALGFTADSDGHDIPADRQSHMGRAFAAAYLETRRDI